MSPAFAARPANPSYTPRGATRLGIALALCLPLGCAFCGSDTAETLRAGPETPHHGAATAVVPEPRGVTLDQGPCAEHFFLSTDKRCVPLAWHCAPAFYDGGPADGCDCNCGAPDPDCAHPLAAAWCYRLGQTESVPSCDACR